MQRENTVVRRVEVKEGKRDEQGKSHDQMQIMAHALITRPPMAPTNTLGKLPPTGETSREPEPELVVELGSEPLPLREVDEAREVVTLPTLAVLAVLSALTELTLVTLARLKLALTLLGNRLAVGLGAGALFCAFERVAKYVQLEDLPGWCAAGVTGSPWWNVDVVIAPPGSLVV